MVLLEQKYLPFRILAQINMSRFFVFRNAACLQSLHIASVINEGQVIKNIKTLKLNTQNTDNMKATYYTTILVLALAAVVGFGFEATAAKTFTGKVTLTNGETIEGQIYIISPTSNQLKVKVKDSKNKKHKFASKEVDNYTFEVPRYNKHLKKHINVTISYVSKTVEDAPVRFGTKDILVERPVDGDLKVYNQYMEEDAKIGGSLAHVFYVERADGTLGFTKVTKANYKEVMRQATADFPALQEKIGTSGFGYKHILKMAKAYNTRNSGRVLPN